MNQAEALKEDIISRLCAIRIPALRAEALSHTLGVCQSMALLAAARDLDPVLCMSMGLLHDCALYLQNCGHPGHARKSALLAETILQEHGFALADILTRDSVMTLTAKRLRTPMYWSDGSPRAMRR